MSDTSSQIILAARGITKRYPGTLALDHIDFDVYRNQVNVLIGENGAGKSTLMRVLAGVEKADEGELLLDGSPIHIESPRDAAALGISIVHQELSVLPNLAISENIFAGREPVRAGVFLDRATEDERASRALRQLSKPMPVRTKTAHLSLGSRQLVEVARTLDQGARVLILDEPTSALSIPEAESLFRVIDQLKRSGVTIIYISHRLNELLHLGDQFTVLRSGHMVGKAPRSEVSREWIVERMSGRKPGEVGPSRASSITPSPLLEVSGLTLAGSSADEAAQAPLHDVSFTLHRGEILGVYGLLGSGRTELLESLAGSKERLKGEVRLNGSLVEKSGVDKAVKAGIVLVPEDRQRDGLIPELSIRENVALASTVGFFLDRSRETTRVGELVAELNIVASNLELPVTALSGGNQQKVLIARCLMRSPSLLLLDEPTRGVDVRAKAEIYASLRKLADKGLGILFTSSEIEETQALADRALVLCQGCISAELSHDELTDQALFAAASPAVELLQQPSNGAPTA